MGKLSESAHRASGSVCLGDDDHRVKGVARHTMSKQSVTGVHRVSGLSVSGDESGETRSQKSRYG